MLSIIIFLVLIQKLQGTSSSIKVMDKGMIALEPESIGIQLYVTLENPDSKNAFKVRLWPKKCYYLDSGKEKSGILTVYGVDHNIVEPGDIETLIIVYPTIYRHNHIGYCNLILESSSSNKKIKRELIRLPFNTSLDHMKHNSIGKCRRQDEEQNDCLPINCDDKYLGYRPFYSIYNICVEAPICKRDFTKDLPDVVYVPESNTCRDLENPITLSDVYSFSTGLGIANDSQRSEQIKVELKSNLSTISENLLFLKDLMYGKLFPTMNNISENYNKACKSAVMAIFACILTLVALLLSFVCCIDISIWIGKKWKNGDLRKSFNKMKRKFNSNQRKCKYKTSEVDKGLKNKLLQDVIATDLPIELRESAVNLCERIEKDIKWKKRYRANAVESVLRSDSSSSSDLSNQ